MHNFDFDDEFFKGFDKDFNKQLGIQPKRLFKFGLGLWFAGLLAVVAFWGTVAYIAVHFVGKFW